MTATELTPLQKILSELAPPVSSVARGNFNRDGIFRCALRAAIAKSFEFSRSAQGPHPESFFMTATLRGMCEDLIVFIT
jgi:hypothetical protein